MEPGEVITNFFENNVDLEERIILLKSELDNEGDPRDISQLITNNFIKALCKLNSLDKKLPIHLILNTQGGDVTQGLAIYDAIIGSKAPVYIEGFGEIKSAGTLILQAGKKRLIHPNTRLMVHNLLLTFKDCPIHDARKNMIEAEAEAEAMYKIYASKSQNKSLKYWENLCERELWLSARKARQLGLADSVIKKNYSLPIK